MRKEFVNELLEVASQDPSIVLLTGDLGFGVLEEFRDKLPRQFLNLGIAEQSLMGVAAGLAREGYSPFVYSIGNFPTMRCLEQIRNEVVYMNLPVTVVARGAGFSYGTSGYSHHLVDDLGAMRAFDMDVYSPDGPTCARRVVKKVLSKQRPAYVRLGRGGEEDPKTAFHLFDLEEIILDSPIDALIFSTGAIATEVDRTVETLRSKGIEILHVTIECINELPKLKALLREKNLISDLKGKIATVEEHVLKGGFGTAVLEEFSSEGTNVHRIGVDKLDRSSSGSQTYLRKRYRLDSASISDALKSILEK